MGLGVVLMLLMVLFWTTVIVAALASDLVHEYREWNRDVECDGGRWP